MNSYVRLRRPLALAATAALTVPVGLAAALPASAATPQIRDISHYACNPDLLPDVAFPDVDPQSTFGPSIRCLSGYQITQGRSDGSYGPTETVNRAQMALFVYRTGQLSGATFDTSPAGFTDIGDLPQAFQDAINALAHKQVVLGTTKTTYSPAAQVTRGQMASFLNRLQSKVVDSKGFSTSQDYFTDDAQSPHQDNINAIASEGIAGGVGGGRYAPAEPVTRAQMAAFLTRFVDADVDLGLLPSKYPAGRPSFAASTPAQEQAQDFGKQTDYSVVVDRASAVSIALLPATQVSRAAATGAVSFSSTKPYAAGGAVSIESVNGAATGGTAGDASAKTQVDGVKPGADGKVTFKVNGTSLAEVVPVVWADLPGASAGKADTSLDTAAGGFPTEPYVATAQVDYVPAEAAPGDHTVTVVDDPAAVNPRIGYFVGAEAGPLPIPGTGTTATYYYNGTDVKFAYKGDPAKVPSRATFEGMLTRGDALSVHYGDATKNPPEVSTFDVTTDVVPPASQVRATPGHFGSGNTNDVLVTWAPSDQGDAVYDIYRSADATQDSGDTLVKGDATGTQVTLFGQPDGTYRYLVVAKGAVSGATGAAAASNQVTLPVPPPRVIANGALVDVDSPFTGKADGGDQLVFYFNQPIAVGDAPSLQVKDAAGKTSTITAADAAFSVNSKADGLSAPGEVLRVTLGRPVVASDGSGTLDYPLTVTGATGIADASGRAWDVAGSADNEVETGGAEFIRDNANVGDSTFSITYNEPMSDDAASAQNYLYQGNALIQSVTLLGDRRTVVVTLTGSVSAGDKISNTRPINDTDGDSEQAPAYTLA